MYLNNNFRIFTPQFTMQVGLLSCRVVNNFEISS
jgi:hypothetical protein